MRELLESVQAFERDVQQDNSQFGEEEQISDVIASRSALQFNPCPMQSTALLQPDARMLEAQHLPVLRGGNAESLAQYGSIAGSNPAWLASHAQSGHAPLPLDTLAEATASFVKATEFSLNDANALHGTACTLRAYNDYLLALDFAKQAVALEPDNPIFLREQARLTALLGNVQGSLPVLERALELAPDDHVLHFERAARLWELGRLDEAIAADIEADKLDPLQAHVDFN